MLNPRDDTGPARTSAARPLSSAFSGSLLGVWGAWLWVLFEFIGISVFGKVRLSGVWEFQSGLLGLLPSWLLLSAPVGAAFALLAPAVGRVLSGPAPSGLVHVPKSLLISGGVFALGVGYFVGGGRHLASFTTRFGFALLVSALGALFVAAFFRVILLVRGRFSFFGPGALALLFLGGALGAAALNAFVLVRLYPAFHGALSFLSVGLAGLSFALSWPSLGVKKWNGVVLGVLLSCGVALVPASRSVAGFDHLRYVVTESSPTLAWGVRLASYLAPPPPLDRSLARTPLGAVRAKGGADFRNRDILLISIDALRADHLGIYGYFRPVTPFLDQMGKEGVVFDAAYAPTPHTSYSVTSLMTGKYMRPLLLQGAGGDSDLWAGILRTYGYRTAAFYPPAVFYIDTHRFQGFRDSHLGFEFAKVEFAEGEKRIDQYQSYLRSADKSHRLFTWVHLFGPHEPYEKDSRYDFGDRDVDRYDSEIRAADETVKKLVESAKRRDPNVLVLVTADHGEEFGDHGGRYHGTTVYEEQVRVPLLVHGTGIPQGRRVAEPVQTIDLLPTVLDGLKIPIPPRIRGRSLVGLVGEEARTGPGRAMAETDEYTMLAEGTFRLICQRSTGACQLFDLKSDPGQLSDLSRSSPAVAQRLRETAHAIAQTHGEYESEGLRAEGKNWPGAILRGISGDADVAPELARLLDDANVSVRRKAAELLFDLARESEGPALRLALSREEDREARIYLSLALTRLGQGAPLVRELLSDPDPRLRRLSALALAEQGDALGEKVLLDWWNGRSSPDSGLDFALARRVLSALAKIKSKDAVPFLVQGLSDVRLRPLISESLAGIGDEDARPFLAQWLRKERYHSLREPLAQALVELGGKEELILPLRHFLGVPDRLAVGVFLALEAGVLEEVGGPTASGRRLLGQFSDSGVGVQVVVPPAPRDSPPGVRLIVRARCLSREPSILLLQPGTPRINIKKDAISIRNQPDISKENALRLEVPCEHEEGGEPAWIEVAATLPESFGAKAGHQLALEVFAPRQVEISALVAVPLRTDLPPPAPEPWTPENSSKKP